MAANDKRQEFHHSSITVLFFEDNSEIACDVFYKRIFYDTRRNPETHSNVDEANFSKGKKLPLEGECTRKYIIMGNN